MDGAVPKAEDEAAFDPVTADHLHEIAPGELVPVLRSKNWEGMGDAFGETNRDWSSLKWAAPE